MWSQQDEMKRRNFLAQHGDYFAIPEQKEPGSDSTQQQNVKTIAVKSQVECGAAHRLAKELSRTDVEKASVRGLESLAWSTDSVADILDYIRMRVGRDRSNHEWAKDKIGVRLADELEKLRIDADQFIENEKIKMEDAARQLHLDLCREYIKHLTAWYEFYKSGVA